MAAKVIGQEFIPLRRDPVETIARISRELHRVQNLGLRIAHADSFSGYLWAKDMLIQGEAIVPQKVNIYSIPASVDRESDRTGTITPGQHKDRSIPIGHMGSISRKSDNTRTRGRGKVWRFL